MRRGSGTPLYHSNFRWSSSLILLLLLLLLLLLSPPLAPLLLLLLLLPSFRSHPCNWHTACATYCTSGAYLSTTCRVERRQEKERPQLE